MREFTTISVPPELLPQVLRQLLSLAVDANHVDVTDGPSGRIIRVHPAIAEVWYNELLSAPKTEEQAREPEPESEEQGAKEEPQEPEPQPEPKPQAQPTAPLTELQINGTDVPVKRGRGRPRKVAFSASNGEES